MKNLNPTALVFWIVTAIIGYLIGETLRSTLIGLVTGMGLSLIVSISVSGNGRKRW